MTLLRLSTIETSALSEGEAEALAQACEEIFPHQQEGVETPDWWNKKSFKFAIDRYRKERASWCIRLHDGEKLAGFCFLLNAFEGFWMAEEEGDFKQRIGFTEDQSNAGLFGFIGIFEAYRSLGYGKVMTDAGLQKFKEVGYEKVLLFGFMNPSEHAFYTHNYGEKMNELGKLDYNGYGTYSMDLV